MLLTDRVDSDDLDRPSKAETTGPFSGGSPNVPFDLSTKFGMITRARFYEGQLLRPSQGMFPAFVPIIFSDPLRHTPKRYDTGIKFCMEFKIDESKKFTGLITSPAVAKTATQ